VLLGCSHRVCGQAKVVYRMVRRSAVRFGDWPRALGVPLGLGEGDWDWRGKAMKREGAERPGEGAAGECAAAAERRGLSGFGAELCCVVQRVAYCEDESGGLWRVVSFPM
jgi:hypothetical protein